MEGWNKERHGGLLEGFRSAPARVAFPEARRCNLQVSRTLPSFRRATFSTRLAFGEPSYLRDR